MIEKNCNLNEEKPRTSEEINNLYNEYDYEIKKQELEKNLKEINSDNRSSFDSKVIPKKIEKVFTLDTLVYEILNPGESRSKNYDKISFEIKNVEQNAKIEKAKLKKKISLINKRSNKNQETKESNLNDIKEENLEEIGHQENNETVQNKVLNLQLKKMMMLEFERDKKYNFIEVIQKLKIPPEKRKIRDILRIKTYLDQSKLGLNFREEFSDVNTAEKLIHFCCLEMRYKRFKKNEIIIKIGDPPESFYTIIFGKAKVIKPVPKKKLLTGFQYFRYLMEMKKQNEKYIFNHCIKLNKDGHYNIEPNDGDLLRYIYLLNFLELIKSHSEPTIEFDKVLNLLDIKPEEINIDPNSVNDTYYLNDNLNKIRKKIPKISNPIIIQYSFIMDNITKNETTIFEYKTFMSLKTNDYFGDSAIETNSPRNATIIAEEDTDIAYLSNRLYSAQIATEKAILLQIKIKNMHQNFFFHRIQYYKFSKKYYTWFINEKYYKGDILFKEGENIKYLYFIQEGSVEISFNKSINEVEELINIINNKEEMLVRNNYIKINFNTFRNSRSRNNQINKDKENEEDILEYDQINSSYKDIAKYLDIKQNNKIIILNNNEEIGIASLFLGNNYIGTCQVISKYAKIYKIDTEYLNQMLESEVEIKWDFYRRLKNKLKLYSKRLFKINNIKLVMTDEKITEDKLDLQLIEQMEKEKEKENLISLNNTNNKTLVNYDKINLFLNERKDNYNTINKTIRNTNDKLKNINLPILNNNINKTKNKFNFSLPSLNNIKDEFKLKENNNNLRGSKLLKKNNLKFNNIKLENLLKRVNKGNCKTISKKTIVEDNMLSQIQKDFLSFFQNKYTLTKDKILYENNIFNLNKKGTSLSLNKNNEPIYLTEISNEKNNVSKIYDMSDRSISVESPRNLKNNLNNINYRSLSNVNHRYNTEKNMVMLNSKKNEVKENSMRLKKKYNHPYYDPLTLIKKEQYKIFDNINFNRITKSKKDYLSLHLEKLRELKNIRNFTKKKYRMKFKINNINDNN